MLPLKPKQLYLLRHSLYGHLAPPSKHVLLIGPGAAQIAPWILEIRHQLAVSTSNAQDLTEYALAGISAVDEDPGATAWDANSFHAVVAVAIPNYPPGPERNRYLKEAIRVVVPGGVVLWTTQRAPENVHVHYKAGQT